MFVVERSSTGSEISWRLMGLASFLMLAARPGRGDSERSVAVLSVRLTRLVNALARDILVDGGEIVRWTSRKKLRNGDFEDDDSDDGSVGR